MLPNRLFLERKGDKLLILDAGIDADAGGGAFIVSGLIYKNIIHINPLSGHIARSRGYVGLQGLFVYIPHSNCVDMAL
jgi:hypothetical protein